MLSFFKRIAQLRNLLFPYSPLGARGETIAARYLRRLGYKIVSRGDRHRLGEIDIVAVDGETLVFVEVKTRSSHHFGHPVEAVDDDKRRRLTRLALGFLMRYDLMENAARFDIIAVTWPEDSKKPTIQHYKNAFEAANIDSLFC